MELNGLPGANAPVREGYSPAGPGFRYYIHDHSHVFRLQLVGSIREADIAELDGSWNTARRATAQRKVSIDLRKLTGMDDAARGKGLDEAKRDMEMVAELGCPRMAAPPSGATGETLPAEKIAERYKKLAELGEKFGIVPMAEVWGFSKTFTTLNETVKAAMASGHKNACVLPDVYHLYKGGSSFEDIKKLTNGNFQVLHIRKRSSAR